MDYTFKCSGVKAGFFIIKSSGDGGKFKYIPDLNLCECHYETFLKWKEYFDRQDKVDDLLEHARAILDSVKMEKVMIESVGAMGTDFSKHAEEQTRVINKYISEV